MGQFALLKDEHRALHRLRAMEESTLAGARRLVGGALSDHDLAVMEDAPLAVELRTASVGALPLVLLRYGAAVSIAPRRLPAHLLFQVVLRGRLEVEDDDGGFVAEEGDAVLLENLAGRRLRWSGDSRQLIMRIPRAAVARAAGTDSGPIRFDRTFRLDRGGCGTLELVRYIMTQATAGRMAGTDGAVLDLLIRHLLLHHSDHGAAAPLPASIRRAEAHMRQNLGEAITLTDLVEAVRSTPRTLSANFQTFRGVSPMARFRDLRLDAVHAALGNGEAGSVTEAATRYGFFHLGRFSQAYRLRFGEFPRDTLLAAGGRDA
ncbi:MULTISPECIES: AraC family transcriptional regulator [Sphingomonadales]|uniref:Helix-turn-helix-domain containing protein, AraC type n=1 Tax=Rhizorhabdus wittichii (strain DSM 6014 / CCUG 31198 / JCM 15750 / NBRC 105917 / EY 4224 / RW1) TaxID=392499 RepID=A0A9J9HAW3_RHIWR|nr:helix-turn-helix- domain containing protein, AraC type [Rhizorhabdus wittichii RW1]